MPRARGEPERRTEKMLSGTYFVAKTICGDCEIREDWYYKSEEEAREAADKLVDAYGGKAVVEAVEL